MNLTSLDREMERNLKAYNIAMHNFKLASVSEKQKCITALELALDGLKDVIVFIDKHIEHEKETTKWISQINAFKTRNPIGDKRENTNRFYHPVNPHSKQGILKWHLKNR